MRLVSVSLLLAAAFAAYGETADWIVSAKYVVTMDGAKRIIENGAVAVRGERIVGVGTKADIERRFQAAQRIDRPESLIAPGLINTHTHAPMSLFRGIADDLNLQDWLERYIFPAEAKNVTPEFVRWGTRLAALEMLQSGTTTFTDMYYFEEVIAEATKEAGMRGVLGQTVIRFPVADAKTPEDALKRTEAFIKRFKNDALITPAVAPHAIYTNSDETLKACRALANKYNVPVVIHVSETKRENDGELVARKATPVAALNAIGLFDGRTVAAHCVWVDEADRKILSKKNVGCAHCPSSNMKLASGVAPVVAMLKEGIHVGLGPDGPAGSNNDFNMFEEMDLAAKLQKVFLNDPRALPAEQAFEMATLGGARVLGMEKEIGSIEAGKRADIITVRLDRAHAMPLYNVYSQLVYALKGCDVRDAMVNGKLVMRDRAVLTLQAPAIYLKAAEYGAKVKASITQK